MAAKTWEIKKALALLELDESAGPDQVRAAWRQLAKVWHPDRFAGDPDLAARAEEKSKELARARDLLLDHLAAPGKIPPAAASLGGWLGAVAALLLLYPFYLAGSIIRLWQQAATLAGRETLAHAPSLARLHYFQLIAWGLLLAACLAAAFSFFRKRRRAPALTLAVFSAAVGLSLLVWLWGVSAHPAGSKLTLELLSSSGLAVNLLAAGLAWLGFSLSGRTARLFKA